MYKIKKNDKFKSDLKNIYTYIALDSKNKAKIFHKGLQAKVSDLPYMPYKFRKSIYFDNQQIRDLIYKGYTLPYYIDEVNKIILLLGIVKYKKDLA